MPSSANAPGNRVSYLRAAGKGCETEERKKANQFDAPISIYEVTWAPGVATPTTISG